MQIFHRLHHLVGGTLLIAGISIGVGMLALPVATAEGGFFPAVLVYLVCWLFMLATGLLIVEACLWMPKESNLVTMASRLLGQGGKIFCWVFYLFLFTCLMVAHVASGGNAIAQFAANEMPHWLSVLIYVAIFSPVVYLGTLWVDRLNMLLMAGVVITYFFFIFYAVDHINLPLLAESNWSKAWTALPVLLTAFGYQNLVPTLVNYMERDVKKVRLAIIMGTSIPFLIYLIWEFLIIGIVPKEGPGGLIDALHKGQNAVYPLGQYLKNSTLFKIGESFAFFAMTTSYICISIAYLDFLADGFKIEKKGIKKLGLCAIIFLIPTIIVWTYPEIFFLALGYAGGIGVVLLLGMMPILMVWAGRYYQGRSLAYQQVKGGKVTLSVLMVFALAVLIMQFV